MASQLFYLANLFKRFPRELATKDCNIDNHVFKLHYKYSLFILSVSCLLTLGTQYFGFTIKCYTEGNYHMRQLNRVLNLFCWNTATFSFSDSWYKEVGKEISYPGVNTGTADSKKVYHSYYRWVTFALFIQSMLFYLSRYMWERIEDSTTYFLSLRFKVNPKKSEDGKSMRLKIANYLFETKGLHDEKFWKFCLLELFNLINVIGQIIFMDRFFKGEFRLYGLDVFKLTNYGWNQRFDPMIEIFPRMTKCTFHYFGPSSDITRLDALCMLPINILNEKIYIFLWFWFCFLLIATLLNLIYRVITIFSTKVRVRAIRWECTFKSFEERKILEKLINKINIGDWFILHLLSKNIKRKHFRLLLVEIGKKYSLDCEGIDKNNY